MANYDAESPLNLNEINFKIAFKFSSNSKPLIDDPRYVKTIVSLESFDNDNVQSEIIIPHRKCTDEDYAQFYP